MYHAGWRRDGVVAWTIEMTRSASDDDERVPELKATSELGIDDAGILVGLSGPQGARLEVIERELAVEVRRRGHTPNRRGTAASVAVAQRFLASIRSFDLTFGIGLAQKSP